MDRERRAEVLDRVGIGGDEELLLSALSAASPNLNATDLVASKLVRVFRTAKAEETLGAAARSFDVTDRLEGLEDSLVDAALLDVYELVSHRSLR